jgi:hypothetical protein
MRFTTTIWISIGAVFLLLMIPVASILLTGLFPDNALDDNLLVVLILSGTLLPALIIPGFLFLRWLRTMRIKNTGVLVQADILTMEPAGVTVNDCPVYSLHLMIRPPYAPAFGTVVEYCTTSPEPVLLQPGSRIQVFWLEGTNEIALTDE